MTVRPIIENVDIPPDVHSLIDEVMELAGELDLSTEQCIATAVMADRLNRPAIGVNATIEQAFTSGHDHAFDKLKLTLNDQIDKICAARGITREEFLSEAKRILSRPSIADIDMRPANCRERLRDEHKPYPRSGCNGCGRSVMTGLSCPYKLREADKL